MSLFDLEFPFFNNRVQITLNQFLTNPTGKKSAFFARREFIKHDLEMRYEKLLMKYKDFPLKIYKDNDEYYFHFKIPSETFDKFYYDVVLQFVPDEEKYKDFKTLTPYSMNFFSNSPHMMFTYTYVLHEAKITIPALVTIGKYAKRALSDRPKVTNPVEIFGFEKSTYYAGIYIDRHRLLEKETIDKRLEELTVKSIVNFYNSIDSQEKKYKQYLIEKKKQNANKIKLKRRRKSQKQKEYEALVKNFNLRKLKRETESAFKPLINKTQSAFKSVFTKKK